MPSVARDCKTCRKWPSFATVSPASPYQHTTRSFASWGNCRGQQYRQQQHRYRKGSFGSRLRHALNKTRTEWYAIPAAAGIGFLGAVQFYKLGQRDKTNQAGGDGGGDEEDFEKPRKRQRIRPDGPWQVQVMSTLPLKALSRAWGRFNELVIPYYLRVPGFKLYSYIFGVNLSEVEEPDLHNFPNLASFFYRTLKPGVRPLDPNPNALLSPADGRIVQFGTIDNGEVEQVKGMTYSLDALLGTPTASPNASGTSTPVSCQSAATQEAPVQADEQFARINGITYKIPDILGGDPRRMGSTSSDKPTDQSMEAKSGSVAEVRADLALSEPSWWSGMSGSVKNSTSLYYCVIYLAPGDYHRFHSPAPWVVERRRHFAGELYSVSPYLVRTLPGLFTLNERVALLGRWRWGFFSYTPVGATNVGSIVINFDQELRTNSLTTDTQADRAAHRAAQNGEQWTGFVEASYQHASPVLGGHALRRGEQMGGFQLGSTIVLVFEAPNALPPPALSGQITSVPAWLWSIEKGQQVKVGQALGQVLVDRSS